MFHQAGKDCIYRSRLVADRFHLMKYINRVCSLTGDMAAINKGRFYKYIWRWNLTALKKLLTRIDHKYGPSKAVGDARTNFINNWDGIKMAFHDKHVLGCSAEGHVSSVFSDCMSSLPMGWSKTGSNHMCKLRCYVRNYGREHVIDLVRWRREQAIRAQMLPTGTDNFVEKPSPRHFTMQQREAAAYAERMQASLGEYRTARKILAIRQLIVNI